MCTGTGLCKIWGQACRGGENRECRSPWGCGSRSGKAMGRILRTQHRYESGKGCVSTCVIRDGGSHQNALSRRLEAVWSQLSFPRARGRPAQATRSAPRFVSEGLWQLLRCRQQSCVVSVKNQMVLKAQDGCSLAPHRKRLPTPVRPCGVPHPPGGEKRRGRGSWWRSRCRGHARGTDVDMEEASVRRARQ